MRKDLELLAASMVLGLTILGTPCWAQYGSLSVSMQGSGSGTVQISTNGGPLSCPPSCHVICNYPPCFAHLSAIPNTGSSFSGWGGDCVSCGFSQSCTVDYPEGGKNCIARFDLAIQWYTVSVSAQGSGSGTVASTPGGITLTYPTSLSASSSFEAGTRVVLTAQAGAHSTASWTSCSGGTISGNGTQVAVCTYDSLDENKDARVSFDRAAYELSTQVIPTGGGALTSEPPGIACPGDCTEFYLYGTDIVIYAHPATGYELAGWTGCNTSLANECRLLMDGPRSVVATFGKRAYELSVTRWGSGDGIISSLPPGIDCGADCAERYDFGTQVTLRATASTNSRFRGWAGDCSPCGVDPQCPVFVDSNKNCVAVFERVQYNVTISSSGQGQGRVESLPPGISFTYPGTISASSSFEAGTRVVLTAQAGAHSTASWTSCPGGTVSGIETGLATCDFASLDGNKEAQILFYLARYNITVSVIPQDGGFVISEPPGISCPEICTGSYGYGTELSLIVQTEPGYVFLGWEGCDGSTDERCTLTFLGPRSVTARFQQGFSLNVIRSPSAGGEVHMEPAGGTYLPGTEVTLTAQPAPGFVFREWQWDAEGTSASTSVVMDRHKDVIAQFVTFGSMEASHAVQGGRNLEDYKMISVPVIPQDKDPLKVFGEGRDYDQNLFRIFRWESSLETYGEYPAVPQLDLGVGYWYITARPKSLQAVGNWVPQGMDYAILLEPGWNQIGCPFPEGSIPWRETLVYPGKGREPTPILSSSNQWVETALWAYEGGAYRMEDSLIPWSGYWVNNVSGDRLALVLGAEINEAREKKPKALSGRVGISIKLKYEKKVDESVFLGLDDEASLTYDHLDCQAPPPVSDAMVRIYVDNSNWEWMPGAYALDFRPWMGDVAEFPIVVELPQGWSKPLTVSWQGVKSLPKHIRAFLVDPQKGPKELDMGKKRSYKIRPGRGTKQYRLKVMMVPSGSQKMEGK